MKKIILLIAATIICGVSIAQDTQRQRLEKHLYTLASDSLRGRAAGTDDGRRAADYIRQQWQRMGMVPLWNNNYDDPFIKNQPMSSGSNFCNLVGVIEGNDPVLKKEYIVIGAHYDHVGVKGDKIYNGADDNASGSSCVLEVARQLIKKKKELKRSVIICAFDAEEIGLYGSTQMVSQLKAHNMLDKVKLMLSVDMVGWYNANGYLEMEGSKTIADSKELLSPDKLGSDLKVKLVPFENSLFTATDTEPFAEAGIATLAVTTGLKSPYHKPEDDADLIDYDGLNRITDYIVALTIKTSQHDGNIASGNLAKKHHQSKFEIGVSAGYNHCNLEYPDATFDGKPYLGFQSGIMLQYKISKNFNLHADVLYNYTHCHLPFANDAYSQGFGMEQHSIMIPTTLQLGIFKTGFGIHIGLGCYYARVLGGDFYGGGANTLPVYDINKNQFGLVWNIGIRIGGHWQLNGTNCIQFNKTFNTTNGLPEANENIYSVSLGYYF
ncbi:MAG: M28 family peptidase [Bacteroidales bacterium]|nr:M28 family peptidase [Bacteroidales bacterium]